MEILELKKLIKFSPDRISREMLSDKPEMRVALMCLEAGQKLAGAHGIPPRSLAMKKVLEILERGSPFVERVGAMPKQGVASTFEFGQANGVLIGILAALVVPVHFITPGTWKKHYGLDADKEKSRLKALQLFPESAVFIDGVFERLERKASQG